MTDIGFVILHYKTLEDTKNCTDSILENVPDFPVVIVDNGSENGTGEQLKEIYRDHKNVTIICCGKNLGFANGNNIGINCIRSTYDPNFVVVLNNDTLVRQGNFKDLINQEYACSRFAVLGPQIITRDGKNISNPVEYIVDTKKKAKRLLWKRRIKLALNRIHLTGILHDVGTSVKHEGRYNNNKRYENVKLHGACWILSRVFFEHYNGINESTFLFFEEDILYHETAKKGLKTIYNPKLVIYHLEDSATNSVVKSTREKNIFVLNHEIESLKVLIDMLE